jgi:hypothetical protein
MNIPIKSFELDDDLLYCGSLEQNLATINIAKSRKFVKTSWVGYETYTSAELTVYKTIKYEPPRIVCYFKGSFDGP